ncbi:MAG: shikimate dehydrogenase [Deltaproteobacteria bacterium]|nr:shikimate dehydrogenase [Deltaproteobacteria bacterium]
MKITGTTVVFTILAHPSTRVVAPSIYNHIFASLNLDMVYIAHDVSPEAIANTLRAYRSWHNLKGFNVTIPHKQTVAGCLDMLCPISSHTGVVNTVARRQDGSLLGYNTDGIGALHALGDVKGSHCLIIGAGGAARAIIDALLHGGAKHIYILNRSESRALQVLDLFPPDTISLFQRDLLKEMDIIIQATPITDSIPFDVDFSHLHHDTRLFETVMRPTAFFQKGYEMGFKVIPGHAMLYHQTKRNFKLFTGMELEEKLLRDAFEQGGFQLP